MLLLSVIGFLSVISLSFSQNLSCLTHLKYLDNNKNFDWPDTNRIEEGPANCYQIEFNEDTYATVNIHITQMGSEDGVWMQDNYNNIFAYGSYVDNPTDAVDVAIIGPPTTLRLGLRKGPQSSMKISKLQVITDYFNPKKKPKETCVASGTVTCNFDYDKLQKDNVYQFLSSYPHEIKILSADTITWILVYNQNFNYMGALGYTEPFNSSEIYLYVAKVPYGSVTIAQDDYQAPTLPPPQTFPPVPTSASTAPTTVQQTTDSATEAGTSTTKHNNGLPTLAPGTETTTKTATGQSVFPILVHVLACLLILI